MIGTDVCPDCQGYGCRPMSTDPESVTRCERCEGHGHIDLAREAERAAKARLTAAAPDLLAALKELIESPDSWTSQDQARVAIAKAEGR